MASRKKSMETAGEVYWRDEYAKAGSELAALKTLFATAERDRDEFKRDLASVTDAMNNARRERDNAERALAEEQKAHDQTRDRLAGLEYMRTVADAQLLESRRCVDVLAKARS